MEAMTRRPPKSPRDPRLVKLSDEFLEYRVNRHDIPSLPDHAQRWRYHDAEVLETHRECRRCGSVQIRQINEWDGSLYRPTSYVYSDGYLVTNPEGVEGPTPRAASRLEHVRRFLERNPLPIKRHG